MTMVHFEHPLCRRQQSDTDVLLDIQTMKQLYLRQSPPALSPSASQDPSPNSTLSSATTTTTSISNSLTTPATTPTPSSFTSNRLVFPVPLGTEFISEDSLQTNTTAYLIIDAVAGTAAILVCLLVYIVHRVKAQNQGKMDEKRIRGVQSKKSTLRSGRSSPPSYARGPQSVVIGIDRIEGEKRAAAAASWSSSDSTTVSSDIDEGRERSPQDHLKQEQLDRVLRLHRQQMEELQALLRRHMLDNSQLLAPHTLIDGDDDGGSEIGQGGRRDRISKKSSRTSSRKSSKDRRPGQSPQGHDSPMVQPDDFVRGPEEILQEPKLSLGRPSLATTGSLDGVEEAEIEEEVVDRMVYLRPEERSILVDCFEKINAHYERQFWIAENEIAHGHTKE